MEKITKKSNPKVTDPPRYPKIINAYEGIAKRNYFTTIQKTIGDLFKEM